MHRKLPDNYEAFVHAAEDDLRKGAMKTRPHYEALAAAWGIFDKNQAKELTELAIVRVAREIAHGEGLWEDKYYRIVQLYKGQVNLSMRTSQSILLQQYSTPAPIGFLAGLYVEAYKAKKIFEPSAGNGLLTIVAQEQNVTVNEIDPVRRANLESQDFFEVLGEDASTAQFNQWFDAVITNPPFGKLPKPIDVFGYKISELDHLMAIVALQALRYDGRMAIIIGGHNEFDEKGRFRSPSDRIFFNFLNDFAVVEDIVNIYGKQLYSRQGTAVNTRLILISSRRYGKQSKAILREDRFTEVVSTFERLWERVSAHIPDVNEPFKYPQQTMNNRQLKAKELKQKLQNWSDSDELSGPYWPGAFSCQILDTIVPDKMDYETHRAVLRIKKEVGGDLVEFVRDRLGYASKEELCNSLAAEQIDAVAMSIYNIEYKGQGMIIGDQTGIGKGRQAAAIIRYGVHQGKKPVFITEKANLFSDLYRDLEAIGSGELRPFIINTRESKTDVKDENGDVIYQAPPPEVQKQIIRSGRMPSGYDFVMATYSQFNNVEDPEKSLPPKPAFLKQITVDNVMVLDEAHNSSGSSNTGRFLQQVVRDTKGVVFLSATFAKRPDNMPIYAMKTAMSEANMTPDDMIMAITNGGVALQEIISAQLVSEGQMIRRERSYEGILVQYLTLDDKAIQHGMIADRITLIMRDIIAFQKNYVEGVVETMDSEMAEQGAGVESRKGTSEAGVSNTPYFSKVFMVVNQMLFSIKAADVADRAIERLREGKKPLIAFSSTMGSFLDDMTDESGETITVGDEINADFTEVLRRGLNGVMRYTVTDSAGKKTYETLSPNELSVSGQAEYNRILENIRNASTGISISPIDIIVQKITEAGYTVAEVTGRKYEVQLNLKTGRGLVARRKRMNTNDAFRKFNSNEIDVLLINQSGSTGASAHAIPTDKVPPSAVKPRVMIVLQAELNINTEVQKRGRINRTGQIFKPEYDYMSSAIPAEKRMMMMLQKKLKSLDANTSSNQKQSKTMLDYVDFLNKYGDYVVLEYLKDHPEVNRLIGDPLKIDAPEPANLVDAAHRVSGRVAILPVKMQTAFYEEMMDRYNNYIDFMKQAGFYDLEVEVLDLQAEAIEVKTFIAGKGGKSPFSGDSFFEKCMVNVLRKPFSKSEVDNMVREALDTKSPEQYKQDLIDEHESFVESREREELEEVRLNYQELRDGILDEPRVKKAKPEHREAIIASTLDELDTKMNEELERIAKAFSNRRSYINGIFKFFTPGKGVIYTVKNESFGEIRIPAIFTGYLIDRKKPNPFLPSAIRLRFAMSDSSRYMNIAASFSDHINQIRGATAGLTQREIDDISQNWQKHTENANKNRAVQYIITGNLLQAFGQYQGKLVSYTTAKGNQKKGILVSSGTKFKEEAFANVLVPIIRALPLIKSMKNDDLISISGGIALARNFRGYKLMAPSSQKRGGDFYLNSKLLATLSPGTFNKVGSQMVADISTDNIEEVVRVMQEQFNSAVTVSAINYEYVRDKSPKTEYDEDAPITSELVNLEAKLLLMLNKPFSMNGADELKGEIENISETFAHIPTPANCETLEQVYRAIVQVQDLMLQYESKQQSVPDFLLMRLSRLKARETEIQNEMR